jgi:hypothetical protein
MLVNRVPPAVEPYPVPPQPFGDEHGNVVAAELTADLEIGNRSG